MSKVKSHQSKVQRGQSLFELVVAIAISALIIVAIVSLVTNAIRSATFSKNNAFASSLAGDATEWIRTERDTNIATFLTKAQTPIWCFTGLNWNAPGACPSDGLINDLYIREGRFSIDASSGKTVVHSDVTVSWTDSSGVHEVKNSTDFTDWRQR